MQEKHLDQYLANYLQGKEHRVIDIGQNVIILNKSKQEVFVRIKSCQIYFQDEKSLAIFVQDMRERKRLEERMDKLSWIVENSPSSAVITDVNGNIVYVNQKFTQITGYTKEELIGQNPRILKSGHTPPEHYKKLWETICAGNEWRGEFYNKKKNGELYWEFASISAIKNAKGKITHFLAVKEEITRLKEIQQALQKAKDTAEAASRAKSEFLASMSHEIRTPMNAVIGMADLLWETSLTDEQKQYVQVFRSAGESLLMLINDILDLAKIESGHLTLEKIDFNLNEVIEKTGEVMALRAHEKGLELACHVMPDVPKALIGDPFRLKQILLNLVGNAIKFTHQGEVILRVEKEKEGFLKFSISDTGIGISAEKVEQMFESFVQADSSTTRNYGGTGLGLSISKKVVEAMQGKIWVESQPGKGSTFYFTAKFLIQSREIEEINLPPVDIKGIRTLVIDDNKTNRMILREMLQGWGAVVTEAKNGWEGIEKIKDAQKAIRPYELVLLDCRMPGMDGFEVAKTIQSLNATDMTLMMLTSENRSGYIPRSKALGVNAYMLKPIKQSVLYKSLVEAIGQTKIKTRRRQIDEENHRNPRPMKVLLVEDYADNQLLIQAYLKKTPHQLDIAENGQIAVDKFMQNKYDVVLMDMQMPVMDGYSATQKIREWEKLHHFEPIPIIALTAYALKEEKQKSLDVGCTDHLNKPVKKTELLKIIEQYS